MLTSFNLLSIAPLVLMWRLASANQVSAFRYSIFIISDAVKSSSAILDLVYQVHSMSYLPEDIPLLAASCLSLLEVVLQSKSRASKKDKDEISRLCISLERICILLSAAAESSGCGLFIEVCCCIISNLFLIQLRPKFGACGPCQTASNSKLQPKTAMTM